MLGHDAFYYNIIRKYIIAMGSLFNNIHVIRTDADAQVKDIKVPITFASKDKARNQLNSLHSRLKDQSKVGQILPRISYTLTGIEFDTTRLLNSRLTRSSHSNHETLTVSELPIGKPYNLTYQVSIWTKYIDDMFQIIEQALAFFNPDYHITVKEIPELDVETNIPIIYRGCTPAFETEYDDNSWRVIRFDIDFEMKGWIYPPITNESIIEKIRLNFYNGFDKESQVALHLLDYDSQYLIEIDDPDFYNAINRAKRWGIRITKDEPDPFARCEYLYDAVGMAPASMNFTSGTFDYGDWKPFIEAINRPVMLNPDGTVAYELDPNNHELKLDGTASYIGFTSHDMNAMAEFKRLWLRVYEDPIYQYIIFSNVRYDQHYQAFAFTNESGHVQDRMYYAMFEGSIVSGKLRSLATGYAAMYKTVEEEISYAEANGAGWHINYKSQRDFITYLLALISKSTNSQAVFGQGNSSSGGRIALGTLKAKGRFWGDDSTIQAVKVFYIENYWSNRWDRISGMLYNDAAKILIKATPPYSLTGVGYTNTGVTPTGSPGQYIKTGTLTDEGFLPTSTGYGGSDKYFADGFYFSTPRAGEFNAAVVSGLNIDAGRCGAWACFLNMGVNGVRTNIGASLSFLNNQPKNQY